MHVVLFYRRNYAAMIKRIISLLFVAPLIGSLKLRPKTTGAVQPCAEEKTPDSYSIGGDHPLGPVYSEAKSEMDWFVNEMAKIGTEREPNFNLGYQDNLRA
jgi:hypothetical protein